MKRFFSSFISLVIILSGFIYVAPTARTVDQLAQSKPVAIASVHSTLYAARDVLKDIKEVETTEATEATEPSTEPLTEPSIEIEPSTEPLIETEPEIVETMPKVEFAPPTLNVENGSSAAEVLGSVEYEILAKLLFAESGILSWEGQVMTCSAILNFCDYQGASIWECAHTTWMFAVAPFVDTVEPTQMNFDVIEYVVCGGGRDPIPIWFRTDYYHDFGTPYCEIEGVFFSTI